MTLALSDLPVCPACGWRMAHVWDHERYPSKCDPAAGRAAKALAAVSPVPTTMDGYGEGRLSFIFDDEHVLTLAIFGDKAVVDHLHWLGAMDAVGVLGLVGKLKQALEIDKESRVPAPAVAT